MNNAWVISSPVSKFHEDALYYFRNRFAAADIVSAELRITADARYKLRINGDLVSIGPYKGTQHFHYYNQVDIAPYLKNGENEIFVEVLQLSACNDISRHKFLSSVPRTGNLALMLWGKVTCRDKSIYIATNESWECARADNVSFIIPEYAYYTGIGENVDNTKKLKWEKAVNLIDRDNLLFYGETKLWNLRGHDYPAQRYELRGLSNRDEAGNYDYGRLVTGFIRLHLKGHGTVKLTYSECYVFEENGVEVKFDRSDTAGSIRGDYDFIRVDGECWHETFWFRTFRYIKAEGNVEIEEILVAETGYPLHVADGYDFGSEVDNQLWEMCVNTLKCCMHETYEDCPYYEQLQYAMDAYLQMLFTMKLTDDCRLIKRGIHDFASSLTAGDICQSRFPSAVPQYITGFSLFLIYMLDSLERSKGEHDFIKKYLGTVETILCSFAAYERADGLIGKNAYWNFIDWTAGWEEGHGVPESDTGDALTVYNLMYAYALECAAYLNIVVLDRECIAAQYIEKANKIKSLVKKLCYDDGKGLYADTDKKRTYSQHAQVWAVLCGLDALEQGKQLLQRSLSLSSQGGFAYAYFVYRAFEKVGQYELTQDLMNQYRGLVEQHCTTIPETPDNPRSECHGWGAVMLYEFTAVVLGVNDMEEGVQIKPYIAGRNRAKGKVYTKSGPVFVSWETGDGLFRIEVTAEKGINFEVHFPDGTVRPACGAFTGECKV